MSTLSCDDVHDANKGGTSHPHKRSLKCFMARLAIGQILREEYVYEVHGPFVAEVPTQPRPRLAAWMIAKLAG